MDRWTGFADLTFAESAGLAFARAVEQAATDVLVDRHEAWVVGDRHISFAAEIEGGAPLLEGAKRLLRALVLQAIAGEATIEIALPPERCIEPEALFEQLEARGCTFDLRVRQVTPSEVP